jgi:membrane dipeptidase
VIPVVDGHNDALLRVWFRGGSLHDRGDGQVDLPRMREGGMAAALFACFVPAQDEEPGDPRASVVRTDEGYAVPLEGRMPFERADRIANELVAIAERELVLVRGADELEPLDAAAPKAILHFEGAEAIEPRLGNLGAWYERGLRSLGVVWSRHNAFGHGVPFRYPGSPDCGPGLTDAGRALVTDCHQLGILVDLAHATERTFFDVAELDGAPLVVSHAGVHALAPIPRSVTDAQLDAIRDSDGLVGIVFDTVMTRADGELRADTPLSMIADHAEHVVERIGIRHVALGSDFDGCFPPEALSDASKTQAILEELRSRGWSEDDLRALAHGNWLRVLRASWR